MWYRENREKIPKNFHFNEQSYDESFYCAIKPGKLFYDLKILGLKSHFPLYSLQNCQSFWIVSD